MKQLTNPAQSNWPVIINDNIDASGVGLYAYNVDTTTGLYFGFYGGNYGATAIANDTVLLTTATDNYVVAHRTTGAVTTATNTTNWNATSTYGRLFKVTTGATTVSSKIDWRMLEGGVFDRSVVAAGDVVGPASVTDGNLAAFDGTTGKLIKQQTASQVRTALSLVPGTDVQAYDADLAVIAGLADPNADRILFWDDSAGAYAYLTPGTGLTITGTTIDASASGSVATDAIWDATGDLVQGTGSDTAARLPIGTAGQVLKVNAGATAVEWGASAGDVATDAIWDAAGDIAVGSGANTAARLPMGSALQVLRVNAGATALEWAAPSGGTSVTSKTVSTSYTRPADTNTYSVGDVVAESTSAATILTFANVATSNGLGGVIQSAILIDSAVASLKPDFDLHLFDTAPTMQNDNVAWAPSDTEREAEIGVISFSGGNFKTSSLNGTIWSGPLGLNFNCAAGTTSIYGILVARNLYVPVSGEKFTIRLQVLQNA